LKTERNHQNAQIASLRASLEQAKLQYEKTREHEQSIVGAELAAMRARYDQKISECEKKITESTAEYEKRIAANIASERELVDHLVQLERENKQLLDQGTSLVSLFSRFG
jgi:hypothetical protein